MNLSTAIQAERNADKAIAAYTASLFGTFDAFKSDLLAADAAEACARAARVSNSAAKAYYSPIAAEMRAIAGSLA